MNVFEHYHNGQLIQYELKRTTRKTLGVYVYPNRRVQLRVPHRAKPRHIEQYLDKSGAWIMRQLNQLPSASVDMAPQFITGSVHSFRGQNYILSIRQGRPQRVVIDGELLQLYSLDVNDEQRNKSILKAWYKQQAQTVFTQRLEHCWRQIQGFDLTEPSLRLRWMKRRWGSCSSKAVVTLNVELIKYAETELDYVVVHELCHLREFNHSPKFYAMMDEALPTWRVRKAVLDKVKL